MSRYEERLGMSQLCSGYFFEFGALFYVSSTVGNFLDTLFSTFHVSEQYLGVYLSVNPKTHFRS